MARLSNVMCQLCLAEAQALTAFRAGQRSSSSGSLVASLYAGAAELYEKAAKVIRDYIGRWASALWGVVYCNELLVQFWRAAANGTLQCAWQVMLL
jgi:hypothetical protein